MTRILILLAFYWLGQTTLLAQPTDFAPLGARWYYSELAFAPPPFGEFPHIIEVAAKGVEFIKYDFPNNSKFNKATFTKTATGSSYAGVTIWDTDGILFEECTFTNMGQNAIRAADAIFNVKQKNTFSGSEIAILAGASAPLSGQIQVGTLGLQGVNRNKFLNNVVGIRATANSKVEIFSNDFQNSNFDIAINGSTQSAINDNTFYKSAAGTQFENTGKNSNQTLCNTYTDNTVGTNIVGTNTGFLFRQENFATLSHDLFLEGLTGSPGEIQFNQGINSGARWNYFSVGKPENIKTSTVLPNNNTNPFFYYHPSPSTNARLKPKCALNDACLPQSNFYNLETGGQAYSGCIFPNSDVPPCKTKACLETARLKISQKTAEYNLNPTNNTLKGELQALTAEREYITDELIREYVAANNWAAVTTLLNEDLNPANRRRMVGAQLAQKQFATATTTLQSFPQTTLDDQYFVQVQNINTARLSSPNFTLSSAQATTLQNIANAPNPEAGYAQTLLGMLTGQVFMPTLPVLENKERSTETTNTLSVNGLQVSPNPVSDLLQVQISYITDHDSRLTLELRELTTGRQVYSAKVNDQDTLLIPVVQLPAGMYLVQLRSQQSGVTSQQKVIVQH